MSPALVTPEVITPTIRGARLPGAVHHRVRNAAIAAGVAALIAAGGYGAAEMFGPDSQALPVPDNTATVTTLNAQAVTENRDSIAKLYGPSHATIRTPNAQAVTQNRNNIANLYGLSETTTHTPRAETDRHRSEGPSSLEARYLPAGGTESACCRPVTAVQARGRTLVSS